MSKEDDVRFIKCNDHGEKLLWSIVCIHLIEGRSREWIALPQEKDDLDDYLCPECLNNWEAITKDLKLEDVRPVCVNCVDLLRRRLDPAYEDNTNTQAPGE